MNTLDTNRMRAMSLLIILLFALLFAGYSRAFGTFQGGTAYDEGVAPAPDAPSTYDVACAFLLIMDDQVDALTAADLVAMGEGEEVLTVPDATAALDFIAREPIRLLMCSFGLETMADNGAFE